jgi:hypothetical protein
VHGYTYKGGDELCQTGTISAHQALQHPPTTHSQYQRQSSNTIFHSLLQPTFQKIEAGSVNKSSTYKMHSQKPPLRAAGGALLFAAVFAQQAVAAVLPAYPMLRERMPSALSAMSKGMTWHPPTHMEVSSRSVYEAMHPHLTRRDTSTNGSATDTSLQTSQSWYWTNRTY